MIKDTLPRLPSELEKYIKAPYGGLFGNSVIVDLLEEITADPYRNYRPKDLEKFINASSPSIRKCLSSLTAIGILEKDTGNQKHPLYRANINSKRLMALTFLSYAILDDRDGTACMDESIIDYCHRYRLIDRIMPLAEATLQKVEYTFVSLKFRQNEQAESGNQKQIMDITSKGA
jgi:hypothetical protein